MPNRVLLTIVLSILLAACATPAVKEAPQPAPPPDQSLLEQNLLSAYSSQPAGKSTKPSSSSSRTYKRVDIDDIPSFAKAFGPDDAAVVIGIEDYRSLPPVDFAYNDARLIKEYLLALGFSERNIRYLTNDAATLSSVKVALESWLPNVVRPGSRVFIFYSGHGSPEPTSGTSYLLPHDGDPNYLAETSYPTNSLYKQLETLPTSNIIVILDACFSGVGDRSVLAKGTRAITMRPKAPKLDPKMIVLSAARETETATAFQEKEHGLFTYYFLKGLKEGRKDMAELFDFVQPQVADEARRKNVSQTPTLNRKPEEISGKFLLAH